jgi:hypothetical protein
MTPYSRRRGCGLGFLDDDLFPTSFDDPFGGLAEQAFYGVVRHAGPRWFLWDTGGGNWEVLYRHANLAELRPAPIREVPYRAEVPISESYFQWIGCWLHEVGSSGHPALAADKRTVVAELLKPHLF